MEDNPYAAPENTEDRLRVEAPSPRSFVQAVRQGGRTGAKWATIIVGPLAALAEIYSVLMGITYLRTSKGSRMAIAEGIWLIAMPFVFYLVCCVHATVFGAMANGAIYVVRAVVSRLKRGSRLSQERG